MIKFFKHHWTRREKYWVKFGAMRATLALVLGVSLAALLVVWQFGKSETRVDTLRSDAQTVSPGQTVPPNTAPIGGPFALINQDGKQVTDLQFRGKYLLIYFGYTYCPDLCPTGLQTIAHALDQLGSDAKKVQTLYITIDPARDTPAKLKEYVASFHPDIIGLTGSAAQIAAVAKEYQVYYAKGEMVDDKDYTMDHSGYIYLMDPEGKFITTFDEEADPTSIIKTLRAKWAANKNG
jgi:cytochrome oxidase Cu insertion factor (SCO1/SenC/PrrC family)